MAYMDQERKARLVGLLKAAIGKWKTTFQMIAIGCLIFYKPLFGLPVFEIGVGLLYIAALLTLTSMISYLKAALPVLVDKG